MEKDKSPGRKQDFPGTDSERLSIRLPKTTIVDLKIYEIHNPLTRNQIINEALVEYLSKHKEEEEK